MYRYSFLYRVLHNAIYMYKKVDLESLNKGIYTYALNLQNTCLCTICACIKIQIYAIMLLMLSKFFHKKRNASVHEIDIYYLNLLSGMITFCLTFEVLYYATQRQNSFIIFIISRKLVEITILRNIEIGILKRIYK